MRLADFILANIEPILMEWEEFARLIWPGAESDPSILRDHADAMLHLAALDMQSLQPALNQQEKSKGEFGTTKRAGPGGATARHGTDRKLSGLPLPTVIAEFRALRASVIRLWRGRGTNPRSEEGRVGE